MITIKLRRGDTQYQYNLVMTADYSGQPTTDLLLWGATPLSHHTSLNVRRETSYQSAWSTSNKHDALTF